MQNQEDKQGQAISLLKVLAQGATDKSRDLLVRYGQGDARSYAELEAKLAKLYASSPDKIVIEKEFADIHPHLQFLMKYNTPKTEALLDATDTEKEIEQEAKETIKDEIKSNCDGCKNKCSNFSSFEGQKEITLTNPNIPQSTTTLLIGAIAIVGIFGLLLHYSNKK